MEGDHKNNGVNLMNVLIVFAHPEPKSLNGSLKDVAVQTLEGNKNEVKVSDLYGMGFKAALNREDFTNLENPERFNPITEQLHAARTDGFARDIKAEMEKVKWADLVIFQFPIWYGGMPAILKGWMERVLATGFSSDMFQGKIYDQGLLKGKQAMLSFTTGGPEENYYMDMPDKDPASLLPVITESLKFSGFEVLKPFVIFGTIILSPEDAEKHFEAYKEQLFQL
jgi:NAD(P)H dehydrogenase (quinone)